jgi:glycolate oxidase FAD binding subunit
MMDFSSPMDPIARIVGAEHVCATSSDEHVGAVPARLVVRPADATQVRGVLELANSAGLAVIPAGGRTKIAWGHPPRAADLLLSTTRLNQVIEHAHGDMTATVQAGCTVADFQARLAQNGQRLAIDVLCPSRATIGGILATNDSGPLRHAYGSLRDCLIGITVVLADGTIARSGGKVVKNVAGYDLPKLFIGSMGTLGVIVEATFRLYPLARVTRTLSFAEPTTGGLKKMLDAIATCSPLTSAVQIDAATDGVFSPSSPSSGTPGEGWGGGLVSGDASANRPHPNPPPEYRRREQDGPTKRLSARIDILIEAHPQAIDDKVAQICAALAGCGAEQIEVANDPWNQREAIFGSPDACVCKFSTLSSHLPDLFDQLRTVASKRGVHWRAIAQAFGIGLLQLSSTEPARIADAVADLRDQLSPIGGSLILLTAPRSVKSAIDVWGEAGDALPLMRRIKEQFDPKSTLSPGRFVGGI